MREKLEGQDRAALSAQLSTHVEMQEEWKMNAFTGDNTHNGPHPSSSLIMVMIHLF